MITEAFEHLMRSKYKFNYIKDLLTYAYPNYATCVQLTSGWGCLQDIVLLEPVHIMDKFMKSNTELRTAWVL